MQPIRRHKRHKRTQTHALYLAGSGLCCLNLDDLFLHELCDIDPQTNVFYVHTSTPQQQGAWLLYSILCEFILARSSFIVQK